MSLHIRTHEPVRICHSVIFQDFKLSLIVFELTFRFLFLAIVLRSTSILILEATAEIYR